MMTDEEKDRLMDNNFYLLKDLILADTSFMSELIEDNDNSEAAFGWLRDHESEVKKELRKFGCDVSHWDDNVEYEGDKDNA